MCCIYDINIERGTTVCGPPVNIIAPSDLRYASRVNDRYESRIFFSIFESVRTSARYKKKSDFKDLHCSNILKENSNFINLTNKIMLTKKSRARLVRFNLHLFEIIIGT